jgi:hypothetical protein
MELHDVLWELSHALEQYEESDGNAIELADFNAVAGKGEITVTAPDGETRKFIIRISEAA